MSRLTYRLIAHRLAANLPGAILGHAKRIRSGSQIQGVIWLPQPMTRGLRVAAEWVVSRDGEFIWLFLAGPGLSLAFEQSEEHLVWWWIGGEQ